MHVIVFSDHIDRVGCIYRKPYKFLLPSQISQAMAILSSIAATGKVKKTANMVRKLTYINNCELFPRSIPCKSHQLTDIARANKGNISYLAR